MATSEVTVSRLKAELTRTLHKHVGEAVNNVCDAFVDELRSVQTPLTPIPNVGALGKEVDYECCWRLVEYMEHNMDTSPSFVQQMSCIILAYQSNASAEILNTVVTQNLWMRRKGVKNESLEKKKVELPVKSNGEGAKQVNESVKYDTGFGSTENEIVDVMNASGREIANSSDATDIGDTYALNGVVAEVENAKHAAGGNKLFRKHGLTERIQAKESPVNVSKVDAGASVSTQTKEVSSPAKGAAIINFSSAVAPTKSSKTRSLPAQVCVKLSSESSSENDVMSSSSVQTSATESSRPREWGKRKRLVTRKRGEGRRAPVKRGRQSPHQLVQQFDQSSTETDNSNDDKKSSTLQKKNDLGAAKAAMLDMKGLGQKKFEFLYSKLKPANTGAVGLEKLEMEKGMNNEIADSRDAVVPSRDEISLNSKPARVKKNEAETQTVAQSAVVERSTHEQVIESDLRNVARDLEAGDMIWGLNVAKAMFQEMLDDLTISTSEGQPNSTEDPIGALCDPTNRSPDQTIAFKTRLHDTFTIIDATLCKPPRDHTCSRDCKSIRAQMCNEFTPCINPTCRVWHDAEAHLDGCTNEHCEFRVRVKLRETMHLIEHKQQEIDNTRDALRSVNTLLSPNSKERTNVDSSEAFKLMESLERELITFNHDQKELIDIIKQWDSQNDFGINSSSDTTDGFPDFVSHYTIRIHGHKPTGK